MRAAASASPDRLAGELAHLLRGVELVSWARIAAWAEHSELSLEEVRVLLALAAGEGASGALQLAELSGLSLDAIYPVVHRLCGRGYGSEEHRRYALTQAGREAIAALEGARNAGIRAYLADLPADERLRLESSLQLLSSGAPDSGR